MDNIRTDIILRDLILKSENKALEDELGFGCLVKGTEETPFVYYIGKNNGQHALMVPDSKALLLVDIVRKESILGQPITLPRVLLALDKKCPLGYVIDTAGTIYSLSHGELDTEVCVWGLDKDACGQSNKVKKQIINLLT